MLKHINLKFKKLNYLFQCNKEILQWVNSFLLFFKTVFHNYFFTQRQRIHPLMCNLLQPINNLLQLMSQLKLFQLLKKS